MSDRAPAPSGGFSVREVRPPEMAELGELTVAAYEEVGENDVGYFPELRDVAGRAAQVPVLVAIEDGTGRVLGGLAYVPGPGSYHEGEFGDAASFRMLAVRPEARGRGIGRALVVAVIERARAEGRPAVAMFTRPFMAAAHRLYGTLGFGREPSLDWEFAPGEWLLAYRLSLSDPGSRGGS